MGEKTRSSLPFCRGIGILFTERQPGLRNYVLEIQKSMYTGTYNIAGLIVQIHSIYPMIQEYCKDYATTEPPQFAVTVTPSDIHYEREKTAREDQVEGLPIRVYADDYLETLAVYRKIANQMLQRDTLLFHGSAIAVDGKAVLFTAKSGTGKSTHTRLWRETFGARAIMVNDDKPLLRILEDRVLVCGTPWDGKHRLSTNCMLPLQAICILERGEKNEIHRISAKEALPMLLQQSYRPEDPAGVARLLQVVNKLTRQMAFYRLHCNMEPEAAQVSYKAMLEDRL